MTTFAQLAKGGRARARGSPSKPASPTSQLLRRALPARRRAPDALEAGPAAEGEARSDRALGPRKGRSTTARGPARTGPRPCARPPPRCIPDVLPGDGAQSPRWPSAPDGSGPSSPRAIHELTTWKAGRRRRSSRTAPRGWPSGSTTIAFSPDGKWMATASGDPGQFGSVQLWIAEGRRRRQARPRPPGDDRQRPRGRLQPRRDQARRRRGRPGRPGLGGRHRQGAGPHRGPCRLDLRPRLEPRRQAPGHRQPRQDQQGLRRREEGVRSPPSPATPTPVFCRHLLRRRQAASSPAGPTTTSAFGTPTRTPSRPRWWAASAAPCSACCSPPTARP